MIGKRFEAPAVARGKEALEEPDRAPRVVAGRGARIGAGVVGSALDLARELAGFGGGADVDGELRESAVSRERCQDTADDADRLHLRLEVHHIVMDVVRGLVAEDVRELFLVLGERHHRGGDVDIAARHRERVGRRVLDQDEMEWREVLGVGDRGDALGDRVEPRVVRRAQDELALLLELLIFLLADLDLLLLLLRIRGRRQRASECESEREEKGDDSMVHATSTTYRAPHTFGQNKRAHAKACALLFSLKRS